MPLVCLTPPLSIVSYRPVYDKSHLLTREPHGEALSCHLTTSQFSELAEFHENLVKKGWVWNEEGQNVEHIDL